MQVPWSVTAFARAYLKAALKDRTYLERTWSATPAWRSHMITRLERLHPEWKFLGKPWLSWIWIDTGSPEVAQDVYKSALKCGCPIRHAASGYDRPTVVRLAVRRPYDFSVLYQALLRRACVSESFIQSTFGTSADVNPAVIEGVRLVHIDDLKPHEEVLKDRATKLQEYVRDLPVKILPAIIVDSQYDVVIDGHHRLELFKAAGMTIVPAVSVNYEHPDILVNPPGLRPDICKEQVISSAMKGSVGKGTRVAIQKSGHGMFETQRPTRRSQAVRSEKIPALVQNGDVLQVSGAGKKPAAVEVRDAIVSHGAFSSQMPAHVRELSPELLFTAMGDRAAGGWQLLAPCMAWSLLEYRRIVAFAIDDGLDFNALETAAGLQGMVLRGRLVDSVDSRFSGTPSQSSESEEKIQEASEPAAAPNQLREAQAVDTRSVQDTHLPASSPKLPRYGKGRKEKWGEVVKEVEPSDDCDMKIIKAGSSTVAKACHRAGDALVFDLRLQEVKRTAGYAYEMRRARSRERPTQHLHLSASDARNPGNMFRPRNPGWRFIEEQIQTVGDGAFVHWREPLSEGPFGTSKLRFSTPDNVDLKEISQLRAVVFPLSPRMGFVEFVHKPNKPQDTLPGVAYLWRASHVAAVSYASGSHHDEFNLDLPPGEVFEKRMPYAFAEFFGSFEETGAVLYPPPQCYKYYENKAMGVALTKLFQDANVQMPLTWVFRDLSDAVARQEEVQLPVVIKAVSLAEDSSLKTWYFTHVELQAETPSELMQAKPGIEALVQKKVQALREARVTYVDGRPFHGYWRIRQSLKSASAASTRGGYQDFNFPLSELAPFVASFANKTGIPVGGVDLIWQEKDPDLHKVSPTSDINPPSPPDWNEGYAEFKHTKGFRNAYIGIRQRRGFEGMPALWHGNGADEVALTPQAASALQQLRRSFFIRILAVPEDLAKDVTLLRTTEQRSHYVGKEALLLDILDTKGANALQERGVRVINLLERGWDQEVVAAAIAVIIVEADEPAYEHLYKPISLSLLMMFLPRASSAAHGCGTCSPLAPQGPAGIGKSLPTRLALAGRQPLLERAAAGVGFTLMTVLCRRSTKPRPAVHRFACTGTNLDALGTLHPVLAASVKRSLEDMPDADLLFIGPKEEIGGVKGNVGNDLRSLRQCEPDSYDLIVEVRSEEVLAAGWEARQNRFYPLGGHEFSLSNDFIINLASIAKVLRNGGKFWFLTCASGQDEVLPFSFLALPHLDWQTEVFPDTAGDVSAVCCTLNQDASADTLRKTPVVVAQECLTEMSRRRYFDALRPYLQSNDGGQIRLLDFGCGDGSLMSWAFDPQVLSEDGPRQITLVESNPELAQRARARLDSVDVVVVEDNAPWPFADGEFDVVVLAFVLHHVPVPDRTGLLAEAARVGREILVLEDLPDSAGTPSAQRLAWHVTQEHFRPFGQDPDDYMSGVLSDEKWRDFFGQAGLEVLEEAPIAQTLRYPVPHMLYRLRPAS
ncbi:cobD [Symbiodinium sp. CCMP2456]|nr:cobD [Symbiodinium sp. CCMP2456]